MSDTIRERPQGHDPAKQAEKLLKDVKKTFFLLRVFMAIYAKRYWISAIIFVAYICGFFALAYAFIWTGDWRYLKILATIILGSLNLYAILISLAHASKRTRETTLKTKTDEKATERPTA